MTRADEYTCTLRIDGEDLDLAAVDQALGVRGDHEHVVLRALAGRPARDFRRWEFPRQDDGGNDYWERLEEALAEAARALAPSRDALAGYGEAGQAYWWCGCFHESPPSRIAFSEELIGQLAALGIPVNLQNYFPSDESDEVATHPPAGDEPPDAPIEHAHAYYFWYDDAEPATAPWHDFADGLQHALACDTASRVLLCRHEQFAFCGGPTLTPAHLGLLAQRNLALTIVWQLSP